MTTAAKSSPSLHEKQEANIKPTNSILRAQLLEYEQRVKTGEIKRCSIRMSHDEYLNICTFIRNRHIRSSPQGIEAQYSHYTIALSNPSIVETFLSLLRDSFNAHDFCLKGEFVKKLMVVAFIEELRLQENPAYSCVEHLTLDFFPDIIGPPSFELFMEAIRTSFTNERILTEDSILDALRFMG